VPQGEALRQQLANSLGETLARTPGIANASLGENVGRPVIRGLQGTRVGVLSNSMAVSDASAVSQDHAVSVEPFLAHQIEVLRGPSTLLYGSGAMGGVVNMVSPTIPQSIPENGYGGRASAQGNTAAQEEFAAAGSGSSGWRGWPIPTTSRNTAYPAMHTCTRRHMTRGDMTRSTARRRQPRSPSTCTGHARGLKTPPAASS
jgi:outer membrane receptor protein involved in Fe transport